MKRIYIAIAFIAVICAVCIAGSLIIKRSINEMDDSLATAAQHCEKEEYEKALEYIERFDNQIRESETAFIIFLRRDYFYLLTNCAATLATYNNDETKYDMIAELERTRIQLQTILHSWFYLL